MKPKLLLGSLVALALFLLPGPGSASADRLCKEALVGTGECSTKGAGTYPSGTVFAAGGTATLTLSGGSLGTETITCPNAAISLKTNSAGSDSAGASVSAESADLSYGACTLDPFSSACVSSTGGPYLAQIAAVDDAGDGTLRLNSATSVSFTCGSLLSCTFTTAAKALSYGVTAKDPAELAAVKASLSVAAGGFGCPTTAELDATFALTGPTALWVATKNA